MEVLQLAANSHFANLCVERTSSNILCVQFSSYTANLVLKNDRIHSVNVAVGNAVNSVLLDPKVFNANDLKLKNIKRLFNLLQRMEHCPMVLLLGTNIGDSCASVFLPRKYKSIPMSFLYAKPTTEFAELLANYLSKSPAEPIIPEINFTDSMPYSDHADDDTDTEEDDDE